MIKIDDSELRRKVIAELDWDPSIDNSAIGVAVKDGVVTLSGSVMNYSQKKNAERAAKRVAGVKAVAEDLKIKLVGTAERSDADIAQSVDMYNDWFMKFAPRAFRETRIVTTKAVEATLHATENMTNIKPVILRKHPEVLPTLTASCAIEFLQRAVSWFAERGVHIRAVMSDNGSAYMAHA